MKKNNEESRRSFIETAGIGLASGALAASPAAHASQAEAHGASDAGFVTEPARKTKVAASADVVVVGGGTSGVVAALAAARTGASTILVEQCGTVGGLCTVTRNSLLHTRLFDPQHRRTQGGLTLEILDRLCKIGGTPYANVDEALTGRGTFPEYLPVDPEKLSVLEMNMLREAGVRMMLHTVFCDALMQGSSAVGVAVQNGSGRLAIRAKVVVDASGDAHVAASAGAPCVVAPKVVPKMDPMSNSRQGLSARLNNSWGILMRLGAVDINRVFDSFMSLKNDPDPSDYVKWFERQMGMPAEQIRREGPRWARQLLPDDPEVQDLPKLQAWFKDVWEKNGFFTYMKLNHFRNQMRKAVENGDFRLTYPLRGGGQMRIDMDGLNAGAWGPDVALVHAIWPSSLSALDFDDMTEVEVAGRNRVYEMASFLKNYIPGFERSFVIDISSQAMSRHTRSIDGEFSFTEENTYQPKDDAIFVFGTGSYLKAYGRSFQVPYRIMLPKRVEHLLVTGECASSPLLTRSQFGGMAMGHAAGTAAALCAATGAKPRDIDIKKLQAKLRAQGQILA
jgi:hypothetical protein